MAKTSTDKASKTKFLSITEWRDACLPPGLAHAISQCDLEVEDDLSAILSSHVISGMKEKKQVPHEQTTKAK